MRKRLTVAFVLLSILLLVAAGVVRAFMVRDMVREQAAITVHQEMVLIAEIVTDRQLVGGSLDRAFLQGLVGPQSRLEYDADGAGAIVVRGADYDDPVTHLDLLRGGIDAPPYRIACAGGRGFPKAAPQRQGPNARLSDHNPSVAGLQSDNHRCFGLEIMRRLGGIARA